MSKFVIRETDIYGDIPEDPDEQCYLNHSALSSMSFGSLDMAWMGDSRLEAEGMSARVAGRWWSRHHEIVEVGDV